MIPVCELVQSLDALCAGLLTAPRYFFWSFDGVLGNDDGHEASWDRFGSSEAYIVDCPLDEVNILWPNQALAGVNLSRGCTPEHSGGVWYVLYQKSASAQGVTERFTNRLNAPTGLMGGFARGCRPKLRPLAAYHEPALDCGA